MIRKDIIKKLRVPAGEKLRLKDYKTCWEQSDELAELGKDAVKERAKQVLEESQKDLSRAQELLYADNRYSLLIIFQAMDAAGKDGTIKHVMSGVNPQGCQVFSFKTPSQEEMDHNFLWRYMRNLPERGRIGIFNRSYYEDVLVVKVHPEYLGNQIPLKNGKINKSFWDHRYEDINHFEQHLVRNGTVILKFFLNVSKEEQKVRFLERLNRPEKNWKFSSSDIRERGYWDDYMKAYEDALEATSTEWAPWYVIPADYKWASRALVADIVTTTLLDLDLSFPEVTPTQRATLEDARKSLEAE